METNKINSRRELLENAVMDCFREIYSKTQPSVDFDKAIEDAKNEDENQTVKFYDRYYMSSEEFDYILDKYMEIYRIKSEWNDDADIMIEYLKVGGSKDKYFDDEYDKEGNLVRPGYRGYEKVDPIKEQIRGIMKEFDSSVVAEEVADKISDRVIETMETCKKFFKFNMEESQFKCSMMFGPCPTSDKKRVIEYWKSKGKDIEIKETCPELFWYYDQGYTDEEIEEEFEKSIDEINAEWLENKRKEEEERKKRMEELMKEFNERKQEENKS